MRDMEGTISRLQAVMQSMADPVILTDNQHRVIMQNRAAERFFRVPEGVSEGGRRAVELNSLLFSAALSSMVVSATDASRDLTLVDVIEGEEVLFEAVSAPTHSKESVRTGMVTVMRDVTDLRRADEEVRANLEKLRAAEEMVRQDRDRVNLVIENVGDPIIVADNSAKIVLLDPMATELFGSAEPAKDPQIVKNQVKLDAYLNSFTFSFADKENRSVRLYNPGSGAEVEYAARSGKIYDARGQVAYTVTVLRDFSAWKKLEQLQMERRMLEMEKFAATGRLAGGKLIIKTQQVLASDGLHGWVKLSVADTGSGIARDLQKSMFEPFVSTKGEKGTGLGLWIVKGIVENHNGRIRVRSRAGKGTVFSLTFPVVRPVPVNPLS